MKPDMCILVVSCDKYADCWTPFSDCMRKFWPDCPYPVYLCTDSKNLDQQTIYKRALHGSNPTWTGLLRLACAQIEEPYIFIVLEDHWLGNVVNSFKIEEDLAVLRNNPEVGVIYSDYHATGTTDWRKDSRYHEIPAGTQYRLSAGPSVWRKEFLILACRDDVDAWNFERVKSFSPETYAYTVLASKESHYPRVDLSGAILRGKWQRFVPSFAAKNSLRIDTKHRPLMSYKDVFMIGLRSFIFNLNPALIVKIQNWLYHHSQKK